MALLIPDEKCLELQHESFSLSSKNTAAYHPGPAAPSAADPAPFLGLKRICGPSAPDGKLLMRMRA